MVEGLAWCAKLAQGIKEGITTGPESFRKLRDGIWDAK